MKQIAPLSASLYIIMLDYYADALLYKYHFNVAVQIYKM